jgi:hypothetical protein
LPGGAENRFRNLKVFKGLLQMSIASEFYLFTEITLYWYES